MVQFRFQDTGDHSTTDIGPQEIKFAPKVTYNLQNPLPQRTKFLLDSSKPGLMYPQVSEIELDASESKEITLVLTKPR